MMQAALREDHLAEKIELPTTQRAYTLRLRGTDPKDNSWSDALWATHEAVNKGAKVFGDWLLTLRGGLDHKLADAVIPAKKKTVARPPTNEERCNRRILLALSWLSVEDEHGSPIGSPRVASGRDSTEARAEKVLAAFCEILRRRHVDGDEIGDLKRKPEDQPHSWLSDCAPSLSSRIREDAVWVNRSAKFDATVSSGEIVEARGDSQVLLWFILKDDYLTLPVPKKSKQKSKSAEDEKPDEQDADEGDQQQKAVSQSSKGAAQRTRHPFSHLFGEGNPFGKPARTLSLRDHWFKFLKPLVEESGVTLRAVAQKGAKKTDTDNGRSPTELHREMFSKAASRIAQIWTKQRQQECDRQERQAADEALKEMETSGSSFNDALAALNSYCNEYKIGSGAIGAFRIRPGQISGWERVVAKWAVIDKGDSDAAKDNRIEAVKELQDADPDKKFGDPNLFIRLAEHEFRSVWWHDGKTNADILKRFVAGMKARSDAQWLKVAAYRHPDAHRNPVFCQFGVSRPMIAFRRLKAFTDDPAGNDIRAIGMLLWHPAAKCAKLTVLHGVSRRFDREIGSACDVVRKDAASLPAVSRRGRLGAAAVGLSSADTPSRVAGVFDLKSVAKRDSDEEDDSDPEGDGDDGRLKEPKWNGSLSTNRDELVAIRALLEKAEKEADASKKRELLDRARGRRGQLRWSLIVSTELDQRGPWHNYIEDSADKTPFERTTRKDRLNDKEDATKGLKQKKGTKYISLDGWPFEEVNKPLKEKGKLKEDEKPSFVEDKARAREGQAKLMLSRLPDLRVLSVDLGHRYAAACAVWETLSKEDFDKQCKEASGKAGWNVTIAALYATIEAPERETNAASSKSRAEGRVRKFRPTTHYRRIGSDTFIDPKSGKEIPNPAPWAKLDRQFLIKLQGEEHLPRAAKPDEIKTIEHAESSFGYQRQRPREFREWLIDEFMSDALRIARLALRRHATRAKIAWALNPATQSVFGMGGKETAFARGDPAHVKLLTDTLFDWHALATDTKWDDDATRILWNDHIAATNQEWKIGPPKHAADTADDRTRQQRRKEEDALCDRLKLVAERLALADRADMHRAWKERWEKDDGPEREKTDFEHSITADDNGRNRSRTCAKRATSGWHTHLRWLTDWIMGWHLPGESSKGWTRDVGGLSVTRIATMRSLYQLHKAFAMRTKPHKPRGAPEKNESNAGVAQGILNAMEQMREQRVKQLASRIVEGALGVGRMKNQPDKDGRTLQRPRDRVDASCHAVVIESLRNYKPDELQTRRENRQLMNWSAGKVRKYLEESCQLHGVHLREVMPNYTSRQDSRTALPGLRCDDVPIQEFLTAPWWQKGVRTAAKKPEKDRNTLDSFLVALHARWIAASPSEKVKQRTLRVLHSGGDIFVAAPQYNRDGSIRFAGSSCIQADLNAAANIGLRALLDPDFPGKWWYVPCTEETQQAMAIPRLDKVKGSVCFGSDPTKFGSLRAPKSSTQSKVSDSKKPRASKATEFKETTNFWCDPSADPLRNAADRGFWLPTPAYWQWVRKRLVTGLYVHNGLPAPVENPDIDGNVP